MQPIVINFPHQLDPAELRRRMVKGVDRLPSHIPGGAAEVRSNWASDDRMEVDVKAMGQSVTTTLDIAVHNVRVTVLLPMMLQFLAGPIAAIVHRSGEKLLLDDGRKGTDASREAD
ncbi:polyhydroxyalkanoic acid system family protein [Sphingobium sp. CR2-8]|uniref:polyhydroxyalkanoic acid system family protein n=1 Tax=Sphingobium sp. CR2-8 TaxID=1306534 RepID=UPI002DB8033E|nr:polyhydroxyalkanoic acid system family protein [Sphingobium sp. CR2-8]MEC3909191.1 polyhydroxyalkanoic acid system family protein [Sphingobium sp. CR2-8]